MDIKFAVNGTYRYRDGCIVGAIDFSYDLRKKDNKALIRKSVTDVPSWIIPGLLEPSKDVVYIGHTEDGIPLFEGDVRVAYDESLMECKIVTEICEDMGLNAPSDELVGAVHQFIVDAIPNRAMRLVKEIVVEELRVALDSYIRGESYLREQFKYVLVAVFGYDNVMVLNSIIPIYGVSAIDVDLFPRARMLVEGRDIRKWMNDFIVTGRVVKQAE